MTANVFFQFSIVARFVRPAPHGGRISCGGAVGRGMRSLVPPAAPHRVSASRICRFAPHAPAAPHRRSLRKGRAFSVCRTLPAGRTVSRLLRKSRDRGHLPQIYKKGGHRSVRLPNPFVKRIYLTALTIASNAFGSFMARSARTLRFRAMPLALSLPMNCE